MFAFIHRIQRRLRRDKPFPPGWLEILESQVPFYNQLDEQLRPRFLTMLKLFIWEKHFVPAADMQITDQVKVVIAAAAVRLVLHRDLSYYDRLTEIVVYPYVYQHPDENGAVLGEAHTWGTVVLSWPAVVQGMANACDGHDTAAHEFAHVLDQGDGAFDGTPELRERADYTPWADVMSDHFAKLQKRARVERKVMRMYGATNEAEFFAVATESYFEKPQQMKELTPDLYEELKAFYGGDPAALDASEEEDDRPPDKVYRNDPCPCRSGKKFKRCCGRRP